MKSSSSSKIIFLFKKKNIFSFGKGGPNEFFYGLTYLQKYLPTSVFFANQYQNRHLFFKLLEKTINKKTKLGFYFQAFLNNKNKIKANDLLFAINDGVAFGLLFFKLLGRINNKIIFICQGLPDRYQYFKNNPLLIAFYKKLLNKADIILTFSLYEKKLLIKQFSLNKNIVKTFYFGVDTQYWHPLKTKKKSEDLILTLGNDMHRDYDLLINNYHLKYPLKIVSRSLTKKQLKQIQKNPLMQNYQQTSNQKLRRLYYQTKFVIVPLIKNTLATSGLSVSLQTLAMEKPLLLAETQPLKELFKDYHHVLFYKPSNQNSFKQKLSELNNNQALRNKLVQNGRKLVVEKFNAKNMGENLLRIISSSLL